MNLLILLINYSSKSQNRGLPDIGDIHKFHNFNEGTYQFQSMKGQDVGSQTWKAYKPLHCPFEQFPQIIFTWDVASKKIIIIIIKSLIAHMSTCGMMIHGQRKLSIWIVRSTR